MSSWFLECEEKRWDTGWQRARIAAADGTSYGKVSERERG